MKLSKNGKNITENKNMEKIVKVWFGKDRIFIETSKGKTLSRPLKAFPLLYDATAEERALCKIGKMGDDIRWDNLDEDIHISSFFMEQEANTENPIAKVFAEFPEINISQFAYYINITVNFYMGSKKLR
jgi:hypothetical protein